MQASSIADARRYPTLVALAVLGLVGLLAVAGLKSWRDLEAAREREAELDQSIAATQAEIEVLTRRIEQLEDDPEVLERLAREDLWMAHPRDVVIVLPPESEAANGGLDSSGPIEENPSDNRL